MLGDWQEDWVVTFTITVQPTEATTKDDWFYIIHIIQIVYNKFWPQREWIWPHCKFEFITKMFTVSGFYCTRKSGMQFLCKKQGVKLEVGVYF